MGFQPRATAPAALLLAPHPAAAEDLLRQQMGGGWTGRHDGGNRAARARVTDGP